MSSYEFENEFNNSTDYDDEIEFVNSISLETEEDKGEIIVSQKDDVKWTDEQKMAIEDRGRNLLVSASAGSGKTAVMTQRIVDLVCKDKVPISNFLIVTFTNASAQDMKLKIIKKLQELPQDDYVLEQIDSIPTSDISDLHSFYSRLISTYFYEVEIDPSYHIIDEVESSYLKERAVSKLFEQKEKEDDEGYFKLFDIFQRKRNDTEFKKVVFSLSDFLDSNIDGEKWFNETIETAYCEDINKNFCAKYITNYVDSRARELALLADNFADKSIKVACTKYYDYFCNLSSKLKAFSKDKSFTVNADIALNFKFETLRSVKEEEYRFLTDEAKIINETIKDEVKNFAKILYSQSEEEIILGIRNAKENLKELYKLTKEYSKIYSSLKKESNGLDFNDLEKYALKILSNSAICEAVKSKYKYIFVDEYQDINAVQEEIISMVSSINNRFMVGDLKQSIYGFRLCDPEIFLEKYKTYSQNPSLCNVIKLNCNFRSDRKILKFVDSVFSGVMTEKFGGIDYGTESRFIAGENNLDLPESSILCFIDTSSDKEKDFVSGEIYSVKNHQQEYDDEVKAIIAEAKYVAQKIAEITENAIKNNEKVKFSDFAVLVFSRKSNIVIFNETLKKLGVPISSDEKIDLMQKTYIKEILNFIKLTINYKDDFLMFKVLKSRLFNFTDEEIIEIRKINKKIRFYELVYVASQIENEKLKGKIYNFLKVVSKYNGLAGMMSIKEFVKLIVKDFKLERLNLVVEEGQSYNDNISKLISALPNVSVNEFLINYKNFSLEVQNQNGGDAVNIITIHKSKGIEYKYVFLINISRNINYDSLDKKLLFNKNLGIGFKNYNREKRIEEQTLPYLAIRLIEKQKIAEEQQRVLYVALTRAVKKMFVVCSGKLKNITSEFVGIPKTYIEWFYPLIYNEIYGEHNENLVFEKYSISDFSDEGTKEEKKLIFYNEDVEILKEFYYKYNNSVNIPLKNSVSKILKTREINKNKETNVNNFINKDLIIAKNKNILVEDEKLNNQSIDDYDLFEISEMKMSGENVSSAERGTAYHKVLENIDFYNLEHLEDQLDGLSAKFPEEFKFVNRQDIVEIFELPFFKELAKDKNHIILKEQEFMAYVSSKIIDENSYETDKIIMQGVVDLCVIKEDEIYILDYKTGKCSEEKLYSYEFQIKTYSEIIERIFEKKVTNSLICFIDEKNILKC